MGMAKRGKPGPAYIPYIPPSGLVDVHDVDGLVDTSQTVIRKAKWKAQRKVAKLLRDLDNFAIDLYTKEAQMKEQGQIDIKAAAKSEERMKPMLAI